MERNIHNIRKDCVCSKFLTILLMTLPHYQNVFAQPNTPGTEIKRFNISMEAYNFTTENVTHETSVWGMRLFGRLLTPTPLVDRALSDMIYIIFDCGKCNPHVVDFQKRPYESTSSGDWSAIRHDEWWKDPEYFGGGYFIWPLTPNSRYVFRAKLNSATSVAAYGKTCDTSVGHVTSFHVEQAAAAWLDVRWKNPKEDCNGKYYFKFRYHNTNSLVFKDQEFANDITRFGMYFRNDSPGPRWLWANLHPCPPYPKENCLFLGEHVRPNATYKISVKAVRFGSSTWEESGEYDNITTQTNLDYDSYPPSFCPKNEKSAPAWVLILIAIFIIMTIVAIIVLVELIRRQNIKERQLGADTQRKAMKEARKEKGKQEREKKKAKNLEKSPKKRKRRK